MTKKTKVAGLAGLDRAFEIFRLTSGQVQVLHLNIQDNVDPKHFEFSVGAILCTILSNLIRIHSDNFMDVLFQPSAR
jgi:hypothetical protein